MAILPKDSYRFNVIPYQITHDISQRTGIILTFIWNRKTQRKKAEGITLPDFRQYYKIIAIKTMWYWHKNRYMDQWNEKRVQKKKKKNHTHLVN